jgi:uncharacterized membrane protein YfcA
MGMKLLIGCILGFLSGLGLGGGSLLMLWLTAVETLPPQTARNINLLFFLPCAVVSLVFRIKNGDIHRKAALIAAFSGCAAAATVNLFLPDIGGEWLRKLLGMLFVVTGIRELFTN